MRYFFRLPGQCVVPDGRNTLMNRSLRFCVRLNAFTATVGDSERRVLGQDLVTMSRTRRERGRVVGRVVLAAAALSRLREHRQVDGEADRVGREVLLAGEASRSRRRAGTRRGRRGTRRRRSAHPPGRSRCRKLRCRRASRRLPPASCMAVIFGVGVVVASRLAVRQQNHEVLLAGVGDRRLVLARWLLGESDADSVTLVVPKSTSLRIMYSALS